MAAPIGHPSWCDRKDCGRRKAHASPVVHVDTNRPEETSLDVALVQYLTDTAPAVSLTSLDGVTGGDHVVMSLGQARALSYRLRELLAAAGEGPR